MVCTLLNPFGSSQHGLDVPGQNVPEPAIPHVQVGLHEDQEGRDEGDPQPGGRDIREATEPVADGRGQ